MESVTFQEIKKAIPIIVFVIIVFVASLVIWYHSPEYKYLRNAERETAIGLLIRCRYSLDVETINDIMVKYNITYDELKIFGW